MQMLKRLLKYIFVMLLLAGEWSAYVYYHLDIGQAPQEADVIIIAGGQTYRETKAKELLDAGYSRSQKIIISPISESAQMIRPPYHGVLVNAGDIISEREATSTWTNATKSIEVMERYGFKSAIVVTSDFHTRRTRMAFERAGRGKDLTFTYVSAYPKVDGQEVGYLDYGPNATWVRSEMVKYWGYLLGLYYVYDAPI